MTVQYEREKYVGIYAVTHNSALKALFNNVFALKKSELHVPMLSVSLIRCKNEALKIKKHLKSTIKCFKEVKIGK